MTDGHARWAIGLRLRTVARVETDLLPDPAVCRLPHHRFREGSPCHSRASQGLHHRSRAEDSVDAPPFLQNPQFSEIVNITLGSGEKRRGQVLEVDGDKAVVQVTSRLCNSGAALSHATF